MLRPIKNIVNKIHNKIQIRAKKVVVGKNLTINGRIYFHGYGIIRIGDNVTIQSDYEVNPIAGGNRTNITAYEGALVQIGDGCGISHASITAKKSVIIGDNVLIGSNCMISDTDFHSIDYRKRLRNDEGISKRIEIGNDVFIGARSIILKGAKLGNGCVVGAGSVVTKSIPDKQLWAGNPAKYIKKI